MGKAMDFEKIRKARRRGIFLRRLVILAAIMIGIFSIMSLNNLLVHWQFPTLANNFLQGFGGPGFPLQAPGGTLRDVKALGSDIVVLNDSNLHLYNRRGRELLNIQRISENTILLTTGNRMLTYSNGSPAFQIHFQNRLIFEAEHDNPIISAALGARGNYALVSSTMQFTSQVTVFTERFEQYFQWSSSELVAMVALNARGTEMAAGSIGASGGQFLSTVFLFAFDNTEVVRRLELPGELILDLEYLSNDRIGIITDKGLRIMDAGTGMLINSYDISAGRIALARMSGEYILLLNENPEYRAQTVILLSAMGVELGRSEPETPVRDMQVGGGRVYVLTSGGVLRYGNGMNLTGEAQQTGIQRILLAGNALYYFTGDEIRVMDSSQFTMDN